MRINLRSRDPSVNHGMVSMNSPGRFKQSLRQFFAMIDDGNWRIEPKSESSYPCTVHDLDMQKWKRAQRAGIATAVAGQILIFSLYAVFVILSNQRFGFQLILLAFTCTFIGLTCSAQIGTVCAMGAYFVFRRSTISVRMAASAMTLIFLAAVMGWLIVLSS